MKEIRTALVTGASGGLGFEAAAQLAEEGYGRVIITGRTEDKAETARRRLVDRTGKDVFETLALDNGHLDTVEAAATRLAGRGGKIEMLLLNAGIAPTKELSRTPDGIESTMAASLTGHHVLTMRLLEHGLLTDTARIVIAGSEAARGDVPTFSPVDIRAFATNNFDGNLEAAIENQLRMEPPAEYKPNDVYATAKLFVVWWAAELAGKLPAGMTVNAVSPGSTPDTDAARNAPFLMRYFMVPVFKLVPGMSHSIDKGAGRYLEAAAQGDDVTGKFFASKAKKMTGPMHAMDMDHFDRPAEQTALWNVTTKLAGGVGYPAIA
ncbi:MAG: SDR family NAD(P)-dependent oxidoreductase [Acidimicrobiia bacterium]|nr:SDR family NAD(P)-dependent oxidoreductase [Acidimicrobiia bacterium]